MTYLGEVQIGADRTLSLDLPPLERSFGIEALADLVHLRRDVGTYSAAEVSVLYDVASLGLTLLLVVEGGQKVWWDGRDATCVPVTTDEILTGRKDMLKRIYPDVDLHGYHERGEGYVARRHAQVVRERGGHFPIDPAGDDRTAFADSLDGEPRVLTKDERVELKPGCRVIVGEVVGFEVRAPED